MCVFCCEHNERASCFYRKVKNTNTNYKHRIEYCPGYGFIFVGVCTTNGKAILIYEHLQESDKQEFLDYVLQTIGLKDFEIFKALIGNQYGIQEDQRQ